MERFVKGDVVIIPFSFSDLSASREGQLLSRIFTADKHIIIRKAGKTRDLLPNRVVHNLLKVIE